MIYAITEVFVYWDLTNVDTEFTHVKPHSRALSTFLSKALLNSLLNSFYARSLSAGSRCAYKGRVQRTRHLYARCLPNVSIREKVGRR